MTTYLEYHRLIIAALLAAIRVGGAYFDGKYFVKSKIVAILAVE